MEALGINELHRESEGYTQKTNNKYASDIVTHDGAGEMVFMSGAEAIARGAIEAGVGKSSTSFMWNGPSRRPSRGTCALARLSRGAALSCRSSRWASTGLSTW